MKGSYRIVISNSKLRYDFTIRRNITIIKGNSATGKTTLVEMIREYYEAGQSSGIELQCERTCRVLGGRDWKTILNTIQESIIFIDEDNEFLPSSEFAEAVRSSDNYYVIVSREGLPNLPYSAEEIYGIRESGKYASLKQTYNEFFHIYGKTDITKPIRPKLIIVEDSNAGYEFWKNLSKGKSYEVISANGKSNIFNEIIKYKDRELLIIADGAAFGPEMDRVMKQIVPKENMTLYLPESFEWLILISGIIENRSLQSILEAPEEYIESKIYFSWERYFTNLLIELTKDSYLKYSKRKINEAYLHESVMSKIIKHIDKIDF